MSIDKNLSSQNLYERQLLVRQKKIVAAPTIICCDLKTPENIGSVLRVADAVGSPSIIFLSDQNNLLEHKKIKKISRNSDAVHCEMATINGFKAKNTWVAIELTEQSSDIFNTVLPADCSFVVGNERHGIDANILQQCESAVHIPMYGVNGSMNVSHALAIVLYEWRRQQNKE